MGRMTEESVARSGWVFVLYGVIALAFGIAMLCWPERTVQVMVMAFGLLALIDGAVSLLSVFRKDIALPNWLLIAYAAASIGLGVLALYQPLWLAEAMLWLLALWLIVAGIARLVFATLLRKLVSGEWLLALSGALAIALGVLFLAKPDIGLHTIALWVAVGALLYGAFQLLLGWRLLRRR
ncbi:DUF308 domain-containing protein [Lysobacter sp. S4-A87]|uniref:HdeD family acid-resistance protein n=1 Tax=Lysobacter sp. S4-A87 TaxID=2925843 RepID=UPI001F530987|nr:DUF308 domain-containing protein [Lysobacter sp. S4-A87]UNK48334.1 DUF308 domain-containing protein [Lysobacter sp. S4-A87]